jgi:hypothetical protein
MSWLTNFLSKTRNIDVDKSKRLVNEMREKSREPEDFDTAAARGARVREQLLAIVADVESQIGDTAVIVDDDGIAFRGELMSFIDTQVDSILLSYALPFIYRDEGSNEKFNANWGSTVLNFAGKPNTDKLLIKKSALLANFILCNCEVGKSIFLSLRESDTAIEHSVPDGAYDIMHMEQIALWYRVIDELVFGIEKQQREFFIDHLSEKIAFYATLEGYNGEYLYRLMRNRGEQYSAYREWVPEENATHKDTLIWEAAKNVFRPVDMNRNVFASMMFSTAFLEIVAHKLLVKELITGLQTR